MSEEEVKNNICKKESVLKRIFEFVIEIENIIKKAKMEELDEEAVLKQYDQTLSYMRACISAISKENCKECNKGSSKTGKDTCEIESVKKQIDDIINMEKKPYEIYFKLLICNASSLLENIKKILGVVIEIQFPVGQGGLHLGIIRNKAYIYDCGAINKNNSEWENHFYEICNLLKEHKVKEIYIYISHLHIDHCNKLPDLNLRLKNINANKKFYIPKITALEKIFLLLDSNISLKDDREYYELLCDPKKIIEGVKEVESDESDASEPKDDGYKSIDLLEPSKDGEPKEDSKSSESEKKIEVIELEPSEDAPKEDSKPDTKNKWILYPFISKAELDDNFLYNFLFEIKKDLTKDLIKNIDLKNILSKTDIKKEVFLDQLEKLNDKLKESKSDIAKESFDALLEEKIFAKFLKYYNKVYKHEIHKSMLCLYSGYHNTKKYYDICFCGCHCHKLSNLYEQNSLNYRILSGWLHTGDMDLKTTKKRNAFKEYYKDYLSNVGVMQIPHHGSNGNHDKNFLDIFSDKEKRFLYLTINNINKAGGKRAEMAISDISDLYDNYLQVINEYPDRGLYSKIYLAWLNCKENY